MWQIIRDFESFAAKHGTYYNQFYVGIAKDLEDRLKNDHNIDNTIPCIWSTNPMVSETVRAIEKYFLDKGSRGGPGGGNYNTQYIYMYLITNNTRE